MKWWQRMAGLGIDLAKRILDDSQPTDRLRTFLRTGLENFSHQDMRSNSEAGYAYDLAAELGLVPNLKDKSTPHSTLPSPSEFAHWRENLADGRVISPAGLVPNTGLMLLSILDDPGRQDPFLHAQLELLLRRVEIKRSSALDSTGELDIIADWLERHAVAILFSQAARQIKDLRFLNVALKLNDWAFPAHKNLQTGPRLARYLWSLAEQETSWKEMLG